MFIKTRVTEKFTPFPRRVPAVTLTCSELPAQPPTPRTGVRRNPRYGFPIIREYRLYHPPAKCHPFPAWDRLDFRFFQLFCTGSGSIYQLEPVLFKLFKRGLAYLYVNSISVRFCLSALSQGFCLSVCLKPRVLTVCLKPRVLSVSDCLSVCLSVCLS